MLTVKNVWFWKEMKRKSVNVEHTLKWVTTTENLVDHWLTEVSQA